jgi:hypothetical protein
MPFYTIWIVAGIFCGLLSCDAGGKISSEKGPGDWTSRENAGRIGLLVFGVECLFVAALWILCRLFLWPTGAAPAFLSLKTPARHWFSLRRL